MGFFGKALGAVRTLGSKALTGVQSLGTKVSSVSGSLSSVAQRAVPFLTSINPELGVGAAVVSGALGSVKNISNAVAETAGAIRSGNLTRAGQTAQGVRDTNTAPITQAPQALRQAIQNAPALGFH
jgi:hypothetical protein